jgi:hypothetical protein
MIGHLLTQISLLVKITMNGRPSFSPWVRRGIAALVVLLAVSNIINSGRQISREDGLDVNPSMLNPAKAKQDFRLPHADTMPQIASAAPKQGAAQASKERRTSTTTKTPALNKVENVAPPSSNTTADAEGKQNSKPPKQLNLPIFLASLPKSGTTTTAAYFFCGGYRAAHFWSRVKGKGTFMVGECMQRNIAQGQPPFQECGEYQAWTDTGYASEDSCYFPSIDGLDAIYQAYPNSTLMLVVRDTKSWFKSFSTWGKDLYDRWKRCNATNMPSRLYSKATKLNDFEKFYEWHQDMVRTFARNHPSLTYVEVKLESPETPKILEDAFGIRKNCWGKCDPHFQCTYPDGTMNRRAQRGRENKTVLTNND